jgi:enoyl-CoA hydratase/carnithine racemase
MEAACDEPGVRYEKREHVAYVTLDRPHVLNAMDLRMHEELAAIWDDFEADDEIRVGVLTGAGDRAFSVGQDLKELAERIRARTAGEATFGSHGKPGWPRLTERFDRTKPLIAKVRGHALGGGFELALACDIIVAAEDARFALPEARLGLIAGAGGVFRLTRQIPFKTALGYLMTGRTMTAARAFELGLVNDVVPAGELDACVDGWVRDLLRCAPLAVRAIKEAASKSATVPLEQAFAMHYAWEEARKASHDAQEGPQAFVEKRPPVWRGR